MAVAQKYDDKKSLFSRPPPPPLKKTFSFLPLHAKQYFFFFGSTVRTTVSPFILLRILLTQQ